MIICLKTGDYDAKWMNTPENRSRVNQVQFSKNTLFSIFKLCITDEKCLKMMYNLFCPFHFFPCATQRRSFKFLCLKSMLCFKHHLITQASTIIEIESQKI